MKKYFGFLRKGIFLLSMLLVATSLTLSGCGSDSYDTPKTTDNTPVVGAATNVLIEPATLKGWIDQGLVNADSGFSNRVVILEYGSSGDRIPGAGRVGTNDLRGTRLDGLAPAGSLVATGEQIDAVIQKLGIDDKTTIVFVTSGSMYLETRAYWTFRYWGFSKDRLKVLDGGYKAWQAAGYELTADEPTLTPSTYSVKDIGTLNGDLRVSIGDLIAKLASSAVNGTDYLTIDARGAADPSGYNGTAATSSLITGFVVFEGHPAGGAALSQGTLFNADGTFKTADEIKALFEAQGWTAGMPVITYCTSGYSCTPLFFALEAILGSPVQVFDGSWSTAGQYAAIATDADANGIDDVTGAVLPAGSAWDLSQYVDSLGYNVNNGKTLADIYITPYSQDLERWYQPGAAETNQVEAADQAYISSGGQTAPPTSVGGGGDVGC